MSPAARTANESSSSPCSRRVTPGVRARRALLFKRKTGTENHIALRKRCNPKTNGTPVLRKSVMLLSFGAATVYLV
jgi:hypothetical protein